MDSPHGTAYGHPQVKEAEAMLLRAFYSNREDTHTRELLGKDRIKFPPWVGENTHFGTVVGRSDHSKLLGA